MCESAIGAIKVKNGKKLFKEFIAPSISKKLLINGEEFKKAQKVMFEEDFADRMSFALIKAKDIEPEYDAKTKILVFPINQIYVVNITIDTV